MTVRRRVALAALVLLAGTAIVAVWAVSNAERSDSPVGFQVVSVDAGTDVPLAVGLWYPTTGTPRPTTLLGATLLDVAWNGAVEGRGLPVVVISHGNGGGPGSHADLAMALAGTGFVVAAPMHTGDNIIESGGMSQPGFWAARTAQIARVIEFLVGEWSGRDRVDPGRIGAFGFSAGGFTVLAAAGGQPDMTAVARRCAAQPEFVCTVLRESGSPLLDVARARQEPGFAGAPRIRAIVVAAPGLGFTFAEPQRLSMVRVPVQLWAAAFDDRAPAATNAAIIRASLPVPPDYHLVDQAQHLSFLAPCRLLRPAALCADRPGFDRASFHRNMNAEVVRFFRASLAPK